jgi:uncharacterized membrane protein
MSDPDLRRELERLAARLARIERQLGIDSVEAASHAQETLSAPIEIHPVSRGVKDQAVHRLFTATEPTAPPVQPPLAPPSIPTVLDSASREVAPIEVPAAPLAPPAPPAAPPSPSFVDRPAPLPTVIPTALPVAEPSAFSPSRADGPSWEVLIGGKWMAWVGALVVILAAGFAVKVGIDQGWWGRLSPITRCMAIAGFGGLLLIAGQVALRRIGKAAAAGLISAGLGTLYLDAFATFRGFRPPLLTQQWAFILMAAVALGGFALTVRTRFLTIGVLSIVGGYLTPILLRGDSTHDVELLLYLTMLLGVSLALAGLMRTPFGALRFVALGCHLIVAFGWLVSNFDRWQMAMGFMSIWWVMILAEAVYTAMRNRGAIGNVVMTLIATAAYVTGGCVLLRTGSTASAAWTGAFAAMVAVLGGVAAVQFGSGVDALRGRTRRAMDLLSVALWLRSACSSPPRSRFSSNTSARRSAGWAWGWRQWRWAGGCHRAA